MQVVVKRKAAGLLQPVAAGSLDKALGIHKRVLLQRAFAYQCSIQASAA